MFERVMWRYYAIATAIVVVIGSVAFARHVATRALQVHGDVRGAPSHASGNANAGFVATPAPQFVGEGGWVMSALPGCFDQRSSIEGPSAALLFHIPPARERIAPGSVLRSGDCTVLVRARDLVIERRGDRLRVPAQARLYHGAAGIALVYERSGRTEIRVYATRARR